eukprot:Selendium_serpulae@DN4747_c0_g1_i10.p1
MSESPPSRAAAAGEHMALRDCLEAFVRREQLEAENSWYCGRCKTHVEASKKIDLWALPNILVVQLKRFVQIDRFCRSKNTEYVDFPEDLDMAQYVINPKTDGTTLRYKLIGVVNHLGDDSAYGHYTAYVKIMIKKPDGGTEWIWHSANDTSVRVVPRDEPVQSARAYLLFYQAESFFASDYTLTNVETHKPDEDAE